MGDEDNLVVDDIKKSVETDNGQGLTTEEAIKNIVKTWEKVEEKDKAYKAKED
ncbi:hypothetical protein TM7_0077 [candidate division TM7 genomosp. GTL1]|nr:hypothetical protein TM7_0077 [candidate division TM7 genomosp. GTL1]